MIPTELTELIEAYEAYITLLGEELQDLVPFSRSHGWRSSRVELGEKARERIQEAKAIRLHSI